MLVSIIIPTKNRRELLRETLASVIAQVYQNWEAIIVDDGSDDGTEEFVRSVAKTEKRVRFIQREREPSGAPTCRNIGLSLAQGEYVLFLDSDDLLLPTCLAFRVQALDENQEIMYVVNEAEVFKITPGDVGIIFGKGEERYDLSRALCMHYAWQTTGALWRRCLFDKMDTWDESLQIGQDVDLVCRALILGFSYRRLGMRDYYYRTTPNSLGGGSKLLKNQPSHIRRVEHFRELLVKRGLLCKRIRNIVCGNYLWIAQNYALAGTFSEAYKVWKRVKNLQLTSLPLYWIGLALLLLTDKPRCRQAFAPLAALFLPRGYLIHPEGAEISKHFIDSNGYYRPVHCSCVCEDSMENGSFSFRLWCKHYIDSIRRRIQSLL